MRYQIHPGLAGAGLLTAVSSPTHMHVGVDNTLEGSTPFDLCARPDWSLENLYVPDSQKTRQQYCSFEFGLTQEGKNKLLLKQMLFNRPILLDGQKLTRDIPAVSGDGVCFLLDEKGKLRKKTYVPRAYLQQSLLTAGWLSFKGDEDAKQKAGKSPLAVSVMGSATTKLGMKGRNTPLNGLKFTRWASDGEWVTETTAANDTLGWGATYKPSDLDGVSHLSPRSPKQKMSYAHMWQDPDAGCVCAFPGQDREFTGNKFPKDSSKRATSRVQHKGEFDFNSKRVYNILHDVLNDTDDMKYSSIAGCVVEVSDPNNTEANCLDVALDFKAKAFSRLAIHATHVVWRDFFVSYALDNGLLDYEALHAAPSTCRSVKDIWFSTSEVSGDELQYMKTRLDAFNYPDDIGVAGYGFGNSGAGYISFRTGTVEAKLPHFPKLGSFKAIEGSMSELWIRNLYKEEFTSRGSDDWNGPWATNEDGFDPLIAPKAKANTMFGGPNESTWAKSATGRFIGPAAAWMGQSGYHSPLDGIVYTGIGTPSFTCEGAPVDDLHCVPAAGGLFSLVGYAFGVISNTVAGYFQRDIDEDPYEWSSSTDLYAQDYMVWFFTSVPDDYANEMED